MNNGLSAYFMLHILIIINQKLLSAVYERNKKIKKIFSRLCILQEPLLCLHSLSIHIPFRPTFYACRVQKNI